MLHISVPQFPYLQIEDNEIFIALGRHLNTKIVTHVKNRLTWRLRGGLGTHDDPQIPAAPQPHLDKGKGTSLELGRGGVTCATRQSSTGASGRLPGLEGHSKAGATGNQGCGDTREPRRFGDTGKPLRGRLGPAPLRTHKEHSPLQSPHTPGRQRHPDPELQQLQYCSSGTQFRGGAPGTRAR